MTTELIVNFCGAVCIILGYANNVVTGCMSAQDSRGFTPLKKGARSKALYFGWQMFCLRRNWIKSQSSQDKRDVVDAISLYVSYGSVPLSIIGCIAHQAWFWQGAWIGQVGLWNFVANHIGASILINYIHLQVILTAALLREGHKYEH